MQQGKGNNLVIKLTDWLIAPPPHHTIRLFKSVIYGFLLVNTLFLLPMASDIWGSESLIMPLEHPDTLLYHIFFLLNKPLWSEFYYVFIGLQIAGTLSWFIGKWRRLSAAVVFISTAILFTGAHLYTTGGHNLLKLFLFYFILIPDKRGTAVQNALGNLFLLACKIQIAFVYLFAGLYKIHGTHWLNGEALYYVLNIREFSHPALQKMLLNFPLLLKIGTWIGLGYQLLFPVLVWFRFTKIPLLLVGIAFHLFVAFGMGLPDFGIFMVLSYSMFVNNKAASRWLNKFQTWVQSFHLSWKRG